MISKAAEIVDKIEASSRAYDKEILLRNNADVLKDILRFIYNPYNKTGISSAKLYKGFVITDKQPVTSVSVEDIMKYLTENNTGSDEAAAYSAMFVKSCVQKYGDHTAKLAKAIVTQNLQIGVNITTLNRVYGADFIPKVGCMLGTLYGNVNNVDWPCIVTEKLDGVRRILIKEDGVCKMYSRSGHEDTGLIEIIEEARYLPNNFVYDGELLAEGKFTNSIEQRQATNSLANIKGNKNGLTFNIFDMVPLKDFYLGKSNIPAIERKIRLAATFMDDSLSLIDESWALRQQAFGIHTELKHIKSVPILGMVNSLREAEPIVQGIWKCGGEGIMLNCADGPYEIKRSKKLLKVKHTEEVVLPVVNILEGEGKYEDSMGAIVVAYKDNYVGVGTGFTDDQRKYIWYNPEEFIGRMVEIETFGESKNAQGYVSLNCPVFKRFVGEE